MGFRFAIPGSDMNHPIVNGLQFLTALRWLMSETTNENKVTLAFSIPELANDSDTYNYEDQLVYFESIKLNKSNNFFIINVDNDPVDFDVKSVFDFMNKKYLEDYRMVIHYRDCYYCFDENFRTDYKLKKPINGFTKAFIYNINLGRIEFGSFDDDYDANLERIILKKAHKLDNGKAPKKKSNGVKDFLRSSDDIYQTAYSLVHPSDALIKNRQIGNYHISKVPTLQDLYDLYENNKDARTKYLEADIWDPVARIKEKWFCYKIDIDRRNSVAVAFMTMDDYRRQLNHIMNDLNKSKSVSVRSKGWKFVFYFPGYGFHCFTDFRVEKKSINLAKYLGEFDLTNYISGDYRSDPTALKEENLYLRYMITHKSLIHRSVDDVKHEDDSQYISIDEHEAIVRNTREFSAKEINLARSISEKNFELATIKSNITNAKEKEYFTKLEVSCAKEELEGLNKEIAKMKSAMNRTRAEMIKRNIKPESTGKSGIYLSDIDGYYKASKFFNAPHKEYFKKYIDSCGIIFVIERVSSRISLYAVNEISIDHKTRTISLKLVDGANHTTNKVNYNALIGSIYNEIFADGYNPLLPYKLKFVYRDKEYPAMLCNGGITERTSNDYSKFFTWNFDDLPNSICRKRPYDYAYIIKLLDPTEEKNK